VSGTIDQEAYLKKFRGVSDPLAPPGYAYDYLHAIYDLLIKNFISNVDFTLENF